MPRSFSPIRRDVLAVFGALSLFMSTLEYLVPKPLPFFRLGLANLPLLVGLRFLRPQDVLLLTLIKVFGQGLVNGTLASYVFLFSAAGSFSSVLVMSLVQHFGKSWVSLVGISTAGALASSSVQIVLALFFVFGEAARAFAPYSLGSALITGLVLGFFAQRFVQTSRWLQNMENGYRKGVQG
ncbi:MAG: Gx transporter family protein [Spirochaetales bacterium]|nr:Gx transporter family protein [Spirochaetales bacterium]